MVTCLSVVSLPLVPSLARAWHDQPLEVGCELIGRMLLRGKLRQGLRPVTGLQAPLLRLGNSKVVAIGLSAYHSRPPGASHTTCPSVSGPGEAITRTRNCFEPPPPTGRATTKHTSILWSAMAALQPLGTGHVYVHDIPNAPGSHDGKVPTPRRVPRCIHGCAALEVTL